MRNTNGSEWSFDHGKRLEGLRERQGVSRSALCRVLKKHGYSVTPSRIREIERGRTERGERKVSAPSARLQDAVAWFFNDHTLLGEGKALTRRPARGAASVNSDTITRAGRGMPAKPPWSPERGQWLREERRKRGIKAETLGEPIGVTGFRIYELERGHTSRGPTGPSHRQLQVIQDFLARTPVIDEAQHTPGNGKAPRITVEIDDDLMDEALRVSTMRTKKAVIEEALREFVRRRRIEQLRKMVGTDAIDLTLEDLRRMRGK
ncbi:MAG: type II toxin-antitoxin system VapB family antitoxin [Dehalococcoidia bacterium]|nr:type II toxin-antitoxin system VapB family antitoxin [Dehalococcoidia bacterium]